MMDTEILNDFVEEAHEHLADIEMQLLQIEAMGEAINDDLVNTVFRAIHSIKGAAGFLGLTQINQVSHRLENVLGNVREHKLIPDPFNVDVMLKAADRLKSLIEAIDTSNDTDNSELCDKLDALLADSLDASVVVPAAAEPVGDAALQDAAPQDAAVEQPVVKQPGAKKTRAKRTTKKATTRKKTTTRKKATSTAKPRTAKSAAASAEKSLETAELGVTAASSGDAPAGPPAASAKTAAKAAAKGKNANNEATDKTNIKSPGDASIRVNVRVLDRLMNLAGELVLSRNQLMRVLGEHREMGSNFDSIASGLDQVTTELQETIMQTRMQPIGSVFNKFPRVIRDLSATLGKSIDLKMEGTEVETDKTIIEAIADPLTHLVRNSCDHGIETPAVREAGGKVETGTVLLRAFHQAGKVMIEIIDDGAGMDPEKLRQGAVAKGVLTKEAASEMNDRDAVNLIFAPGFSTAASVTNVSGRGVGMDVVRTNIEKIGGSVEVESELGVGSTIRITLPLTLAIVPSMIVSVGGRAFALPQSNIVELVQTGGLEKRIERVSNAEVLRLRGSLLPLVRLDAALGMPASETASADTPEVAEGDDAQPNSRESQLAVVEAGRNRFALAVDRVLDSEEIVVKPLGRHLTSLTMLAGSTILGDGRVAMILDAGGIAAKMSIPTDAEAAGDEAVSTSADDNTDLQCLVLLSTSDRDHFAVSMDIVSRIERVRADAIDSVGDRRVLQYRGGTLPLLSVDEVVTVSATDETEFVHVIVFKVYGREVGLVTPHLEDILNCDVAYSSDACGQPGVVGVSVIRDCTTRILDVYGLTEIARPEWFDRQRGDQDDQVKLRILVCEDSSFFLNFLEKTLTEHGHTVAGFEDGELGWEALTASPDQYDLLLTDVEMPRLDGLGLTRRIRADGRFDDLPIVALTSLADEVSMRLGLDAGVDDYQIKMNKPELLASIRTLANKGAKV